MTKCREAVCLVVNILLFFKVNLARVAVSPSTFVCYDVSFSGSQCRNLGALVANPSDKGLEFADSIQNATYLSGCSSRSVPFLVLR